MATLVDPSRTLFRRAFDSASELARSRLLPLTDFLHLSDELKRLTYLVMRAGHTEQNPDGLTIFANVAFLGAEGAEILSQHPTGKVKVDLQVVGMSDVLKAPLEQLLLVVAGDLTKCAVDFQTASFRRHQGHADGSVIEAISETALGLAKRFLHAAAFGNLILQACVDALQLLASLVNPGFEAAFVVPQCLDGSGKFRRVFLDLTRHGVEGRGQVVDLHDSRYTRARERKLPIARYASNP